MVIWLTGAPFKWFTKLDDWSKSKSAVISLVIGKFPREALYFSMHDLWLMNNRIDWATQKNTPDPDNNTSFIQATGHWQGPVKIEVC